MGRRRVRAGREEELSPARASTRHSSAFQRCTAPWLWCSVFFFAFISQSACAPDDNSETTIRDVLRIGYPEGVTGGPNVGVQELVAGLSLEGLTQVGLDGKAAPRLAESWTWESENRRLAINLRKGVTFHDGTPLTSTLAATFLRQAIQRPGNRIRYASFRDIEEIRSEGDLRLLVELTRPSAFLLEDLDLQFAIGPENIGSGPYRVVRREPKEIVFERFSRYYLGEPKVRQLVVRPFETLRTAWTSLLRGEVDMVTDVPPDAFEFIRNDDIQVISFARRYQVLIAFNSQRGPLTSPIVRRALNVAINRDSLIRKVLQNRGEAATGPLWPQYWAYDTSIAPYMFDPDLAVSLLESAGYRLENVAHRPDRSPSRLRFTCLIPAGFSTWERIALEVQKDLYNIGVDMQFQVVPFQEFDGLVRGGQFDAALLDLISGPPSRAYIFWQSTRQYQGLNVFGYTNPEAERQFETLRTTTNEGAIRSATRRLQTVFLEDPPALFLVWNQRARAIRRDFEIPPGTDRDPMLTIWQWTPETARRALATQ